MTFSSLTDQPRISQQRSSRNGVKVDHVILHHCASTNVSGVLNMMVSGSKEVSANYVVSNEGVIFGVVPEEYRAFTSGSIHDGGKGAAWDRRSITFEIENEAMGGTWPVSARAHEAVASVVADVAKRYGFKINGDTILGHKDLWERHGASYPTACPGGLSVSRVITRANEILNGDEGAESLLLERKKKITWHG